jgi:acylphosphatase
VAESRVVHVFVSGRVQGVGFRNWTLETARGLGLRGWVRNRRDGAVEALFSGPPDGVAAMLAACQRGPSAARVTDVRSDEIPAPTDLPLMFEQRETA